MIHRTDSRQSSDFVPFQNLMAANYLNHKQCSICLVTYDSNTLITFGKCGHVFCKDCMTQHLNFSLKRYNMPKCPKQLCLQQLETDSQAYQILDENQRKRYKKIVSYIFILRNPNYSPCQKENCTGIIDKTSQQCQCNLCEQKHCQNCYQSIHVGQCRARIAMQLETRQKFRECKNCGQIIQKIEGCTHMVCTCGHSFCYSCGQTLTNFDHQCTPPSQLNFLQSVRWSIEHEQYWYQFSEINFLHFLLFVSPPRNAGVILKVLWAFGYLIVIYPISIVLSLVLSTLTLIFLSILFITFTIFIPFMPLFSENVHLWFSSNVYQQFGPFIAFPLILCMYPILYFVSMCQFISIICQEEDITAQQFCILPIQLLKGIRNMVLMPCLMLIDNERYYLALGKLRRDSLLNQQI